MIINKVEITHKESLQLLEVILKKYKETLLQNNGEYKDFSLAMESIQKTWHKAFDEDRLKIIACLDQQKFVEG